MSRPAVHPTGRASASRRLLFRALLALCGAGYLLLGLSAVGATAALGVGGAALIWASLALAARSPRWARAVLAVGVLPFAIAAWWSVAVPALGLATIAVGLPALRPRASYRP